MDIVIARELVAAGLAVKFIAQKVDDGYTLFVETPSDTRALTAQRGHPRVFRKLDTIASTLDEIGAKTFIVRMSSAK